MKEIVDILKQKELHFPRLLLNNYKKLGITDTELIIIIYLINTDSDVYNPKQIGEQLDMKMNTVLEIINNLTEKGILSLDIVKVNRVSSEVINLDLLYEKLAYVIVNNTVAKSSDNNIFEVFESELGRALSPMEYEIINGWLDIDYSTELITCALKEATYNGISNFRYIDRILYEWNKKGIKTKEDVEKNKKEFKKKKNNNVELFDYDWLNEK